MVPQIYKIYFYENALVLASSPSELKGIPNLFFIDDNELQKTLAILESIESMNTKVNYVLISDEVEDVFKKIQKKMSDTIEAAGGIVLNEQKEMLAIFRHKRWDLPKGKIEKDEKRKEAALREVKEECGIFELEVGEKAGQTYHSYNEEGRRILKITHWFYMKAAKDQPIKPQAEEGITEIRWVEPSFFNDVNIPSYNSIREFVQYLGKVNVYP